MRNSKFNVDQVFNILQEGSENPVNVCSKYHISVATFYKWRAKYGSISSSQLHRLKELEEYNKKLEKLYAQAIQEKNILQQAVVGKL